MAEQESGPLLDLADQLTELKINEVRDLFAAENIASSPTKGLAHLRIQTNEKTVRHRNYNEIVPLAQRYGVGGLKPYYFLLQPRPPVDHQNQVVTGPGLRPEPHTAEIAGAGSGHVKPQQQQASCERSSEDAHKIKLIQQQMVLLLHTHRCRQLDAMDNNRQCNLPLCLKLKPVVEHVADCTVGSHCPFPQCKSSRKLISHWRHCLSTECPVCWPLKLVDQNRRQLEHERSQRSQSV